MAQSWKLVYTTDAKKISTKGMNEEFGMHVNRPFFIVSKMWMERVVECIGGGNLQQRTLNRNSKGQQFFLDPYTNTIKSAQWKDRSINIEGNGRSNNLFMRTTSARWF